MQAKGKPTTAQFAFALEKTARIETIKIGNKKQIKKIFCIDFNFGKYIKFFVKQNKGMRPNINI